MPLHTETPPLPVMLTTLPAARLSETYPSVRFCKFDVDQLHDVGAELEIRAMPTFSIFQDGQRIEQVVGANPRALQQWLERLTKAE